MTNDFRPPEGCIMCEDDPQFCGPFCDAWRDACQEQVQRDHRNNSPALAMCEGCTWCHQREEGHQSNWLFDLHYGDD